MRCRRKSRRARSTNRWSPASSWTENVAPGFMPVLSMNYPTCISRRHFLVLTTRAAVVPGLLFAENEVPTLLDHILLGSNDLQRGIDLLAQHTGVRATFGGVHPG